MGINFHCFFFSLLGLFVLENPIVKGFVCKNLSDEALIPDKFLILNSYEPRSSLLRYQALPGLALGLLNIQESCTLNKGC